MQIPLECGYPAGNSRAELEFLKGLEREGIIHLQEEEFINCKKCGDPIDIREFENNSTVNCPKCDQTCGMSTSRKKRTVITEVNRNKILIILDNQIRNAFGTTNVTFDKFDNNWTIRYNGQKYLFFIFGISTTTSFLSMSDNEGIIAYLDERKILSQVHDLNKSRYRYIFDPTFSNPKEFRAFIDSLNFTETMKYLKFRERFENFIATQLDGTQYEKEFIPNFIEGIKLKSNELSKLYSRLMRVENTILNSKCIKFGGAGREDFFLINLCKYLQDGLQNEKYGESKKYLTSHFSFSHFTVALGHAAFRDSLFFISTCDIAPSVWKMVIEEKRGEHFKYVILDKDLMLLLLYNLDLLDLIE
jgi:hypothetical protein